MQHVRKCSSQGLICIILDRSCCLVKRNDAFTPIIKAKRKMSTNKALWRNPITEPKRTVVVRCWDCKSPSTDKVDRAPTYETATGKYIIRQQRCDDCPRMACGKRAQISFHPVDGHRTIRERQLGREAQNKATKAAAKKRGEERRNKKNPSV